jgi:phosphatidylglycerophosphatase A
LKKEYQSDPGLALLRNPVHFLAFGGGAGLAPRAPGTFGTLVGLVPAWLMLDWALPWRIAAVVAIALLGVWICGTSARLLGRHDHPGIVFDEIAGILATALIIASGSLVELALAFVLFRIFDIAKPWPIRDVDHRLHGGTGIMLDDLMAAVYAAAGLRVIQIFLPTT